MPRLVLMFEIAFVDVEVVVVAAVVVSKIKHHLEHTQKKCLFSFIINFFVKLIHSSHSSEIRQVYA